jgi:hypothetical protein
MLQTIQERANKPLNVVIPGPAGGRLHVTAGASFLISNRLGGVGPKLARDRSALSRDGIPQIEAKPLCRRSSATAVLDLDRTSSTGSSVQGSRPDQFFAFEHAPDLLERSADVPLRKADLPEPLNIAELLAALL